MTKVLKINKDIIQQILREEHENKIKKLEQLQVEQNMQVFNALSENPKLTIVNETVKKRSLSPKEKVQKLPKVIVKTNFLREELFEEDEDLQDLDIFYKSPAEMNDHIHEVIQKKLSDGNVDMNKPKTALAVNTSSKSMSMPAQNPRPNTVGFKFRFGKLDFTDKIVNALDTHKFNNEDGNIKSPQMKKLAISSFNSPMHELVSSKSDHKLDLGSPTSQFAQHHFMMPQTTTSATKIHSMELKPDMLLSESINFLKFEKDRVFQDFKAKFKQPPKTSDAKMRTKKTIYSKPRAEDLPSPIHAEMITSGDFFENLHKFDDLEDDIFEEQTKKEKPLFPKVLYPRKPIKPSTAAPAAGVAYYQNQSPRGQNKGSSRALIKVNRLQPTGAINNNGQNTYITSQDPLAPTSLGYFKPKSGNFYTRMHQNLVNKEAMFEEIKKNEQYKTHLRTVDPNPLSGLMIQAGVAHLQANTTKNDKKNKFSLTAGAGNFWKNNS